MTLRKWEDEDVDKNETAGKGEKKSQGTFWSSAYNPASLNSSDEQIHLERDSAGWSGGGISLLLLLSSSLSCCAGGYRPLLVVRHIASSRISLLIFLTPQAFPEIAIVILLFFCCRRRRHHEYSEAFQARSEDQIQIRRYRGTYT